MGKIKNWHKVGDTGTRIIYVNTSRFADYNSAIHIQPFKSSYTVFFTKTGRKVGVNNFESAKKFAADYMRGHPNG